jgi:hypothetical protein
MPSERKLNVSLSMKIKGESTSVKVEEGRVVIEGFVNEINNKLCVVPNARTLRIKKQNRRAEGTTDMNKRKINFII